MTKNNLKIVKSGKNQEVEIKQKNKVNMTQLFIIIRSHSVGVRSIKME